MIFISVDLPAPFSPSTAWISPGATVQVDAVVGVDGGVLLADADQLEARRHGCCHPSSPMHRNRRCGACNGCVRPPAWSTRLRSSPSIIHANRRSCRSRANAVRGAATAPTGPIPHGDVRRTAGLKAADLVVQLQRLCGTESGRVQRLERAQASRRAAPARGRHRPACGSSTGWCHRRHRWPSTPSRPRRPSPASRTIRCRGRGSSSGCARSARRCRPAAVRSASSSQMPCASTARAFEQAMAVRTRRGSCAHRETARATQRHLGAVLGDVGLHVQARVALASSAPAIASCSGVLVGAKRGVTA